MTVLGRSTAEVHLSSVTADKHAIHKQYKLPPISSTAENTKCHCGKAKHYWDLLP